jgi:general secretion pathway protein I
MTLKSRTAQAGFSLLEAIVALAIIGLALVPLLGFVAQSLDSVYRAADAQLRATVLANAVDAMSGVNPMRDPRGEIDLGGPRVRWQSRALVSPMPNSNIPTGFGAFNVALYDVQANVLRADGSPWFDFQLRLAGHRRTTPLTNPFASATGAPQR